MTYSLSLYIMKLNKYILTTLILVSISLACRTGSNKDKLSSVYHYGNLDSIMKGDFPVVFDLDSLAGKENVYALGTMEDLSGELQIFNSKPYHSTVEKDSIIVGTGPTSQASLLVYAQVRKWKEIAIPLSVVNLEALVGFLEYDEQMIKIGSDRPLVFTIEGMAEQIKWHVLQKMEPDSTHKILHHKDRAFTGSLEDVEVEVLGFYSRDHEGIFTHHNVPIHLHFRTLDGRVAGHVDDLELGRDMVLKLPNND